MQPVLNYLMRCGRHNWKFIILSAVLLAAGLAHAEEAVPVQIGTTGLYLPNQALSQDKHYLRQDDDLMGRVGCLLQEMDSLLAQLHALPAERSGAPETLPPTAEELPLLIALALQHNPALEPLRSQLAVAGAMARQAGAKPDPMAMFGVASIPLPQFELADEPMAMFNFGWSQEFISYGKRGLKRNIASIDAGITELDLSSEELMLIDSVSMQYFDLLATRARQEALAQNIELLKLLLALAERKYALGLTPQGQVAAAQVKLTDMEQRQYALEQQLARQAEALYGALGRPAGFDPAALSLRADYAVPQPVALAQDALLEQMLRRRPDMQSFMLQQQQQQMRIELATREYRPDYTVSAEYGMRWGVRDLFAFNISIPVFTHKAERQDAMVQEQAARADMLEQQQAALENELATRLGLLQLDLDRITELSARFRTALVPQARLALDSLIAGYAANQTGLDELLMAQDTLLDYELELQQLSIDYLATLTQLQIATAGAFDPAPYLNNAAAGVASAIPAVLPSGVEAQVTSEEQAQLDSLFLAPPGQAGTAVPPPPPVAGELVESLGLPPAAPAPDAPAIALLAQRQARAVRSQAARLLLQGVVEPAAQAWSAAVPPVPPAATAADFYTPFAPTQSGKEQPDE